MSPPFLGVEEGRQPNDGLMPSPTYEESDLKEHNYFGASECSSVDRSAVASFCLSEDSKDSLNLKATELRLGLPGCQSPERDKDPNLCLLISSKFNEKPLFPLAPLKDGISSSSQTTVLSGSKRGFSDAVEDVTGKTHEPSWRLKPSGSGHDSDTQKSIAQGKLLINEGRDFILASSRPNLGAKSFPRKEQPVGSQALAKALEELPLSNGNNNALPAKAQVVGWPPIRSSRKNTLATSSKNSDPVFVKVSMNGAPYLRKVDLRTYTTYQQLSSGLEKMFSCFTLGQCESHGTAGRENMNETKLKDLLHGSEHVLTYEDKDGDWMLVGDVPWEMFIDSCKRLKIVKSSDAIGLAPRATGKSNTY